MVKSTISEDAYGGCIPHSARRKAASIKEEKVMKESRGMSFRKPVSRRTFLGTSAVAAAASGIVSVPASAHEASEAAPGAAQDVESLYECWVPPQGEVAFEAEPVTDISATEQWDVVIVGMGAAGSAAAAFAAANGLKTIVVEKMPYRAANPGDIFAPNSKILSENGADSPSFNDFMDALMTSSAYRASAPKLRAMYYNAGPAFDWLYDNAIHPAGITAVPSYKDFGGPVMMEGWTRCLNASVTWAGGRNEQMADVHTAIADFAVNSGAEIRYETPAVQLVQDESGAVTGVIVKDADGMYTQLDAGRGVILATGGYAGNIERMKKYLRPREYATIAAVQMANFGVTGDGHEMGLAVGAAEDDAPHSILLNNYALADSHEMGIPTLMIPWVRVNYEGVRFVNEEVPVSMMGAAVANQPHGRCWTVFDANYGEALSHFTGALISNNPGITEGAKAIIDGMIEAGAIISADTVEELAEKIGVRAETLAATFERTSQDFHDGEDTLFGHTCFYALDTPPFYAIHEGPTMLSTCSGLTTDEWARVLTYDHDVIPGLYAIGECAGGLWNGGIYTHHVYGGDWGASVAFAMLCVQDIVEGQ